MCVDMKHLIFCVFFGIIGLSSAMNETCVTKLGIFGICKPITDCDFILEGLNSGDLSRLKSCNYTGEIGIYCCPIHFNPMHSKLTPSCQKIIPGRELLGLNSVKYNEKGSTTSIYELPFMAQVLFRGKDFVGAGVLLSAKFVLTAAHTVYVRRSMPIVRLGKSTLDERDLLPGVNITVKQVIPHELFLTRETSHDIALLLLEQHVELSDVIFPVCLHNYQIELDIDQKIILSGWKGNNGKKINELMKGEVQKVPKSRCEVFYNKTEYIIKLPEGISSNLFCGETENCIIDSDGPIHVFINNTFYIYGFATSINTNCNSELPGLYTKISDVVDWIENIITSIDAP